MFNRKHTPEEIEKIRQGALKRPPRFRWYHKGNIEIRILSGTYVPKGFVPGRCRKRT